MKVDVLLGLQWGDEGKGKIVDYLAPKYNVVARFQGGPNAGHTLAFEGIKHVLHQIPSGIFRNDIKNIIGNGVVLDPVVFKKEILGLDQLDVGIRDKLFVSKKAQIILPTHLALDAAHEKNKGNQKIGSTLKGIGPAYSDKIARQGLRVGDILHESFLEKYRALKEKHLQILGHYQYPYDPDEPEERFFEAVEFLKTFPLVESEYWVNQAMQGGASVLAEGAQGAMLDVDFGSYPFVTSSNTTAAGACTGLGIAPNAIGEVYGIFKAYCTRVGSGPFPTELFDDDGQKMRDVGHEYGATTGRERRCGWLDLPALKYAVMVNGVTQLFMMKADVLNAFGQIKVCTAYETDSGEKIDTLAYDMAYQAVKPIYQSFPGWGQSLDGKKSFEELPEPLLQYVAFLENHVGVPINIISVGPDRTQTIIRNEVLA